MKTTDVDKARIRLNELTGEVREIMENTATSFKNLENETENEAMKTNHEFAIPEFVIPEFVIPKIDIEKIVSDERKRQAKLSSNLFISLLFGTSAALGLKRKGLRFKDLSRSQKFSTLFVTWFASAGANYMMNKAIDNSNL